MNSNKKSIPASSPSAPFHRPLGAAHPFKPPVAQLKTRVSAQSVRHPIAPPVYRPQQTPKVLQTKRSSTQNTPGNQEPRRPVAPAVYRPEAKSVMQPKAISQQRRQPAAPPVYRPQTKSLAQMKTGVSQMKKPAIAPPGYNTQLTPKALQMKKPITRQAFQTKSASRRVPNQSRPGSRGHFSPRESMIQLMTVYRVHDNDAERKRLKLDPQGNVTITNGPLNVSFGEPDHAAYFLRGKDDKDVVTFEIKDEFFHQLRDAMVSQREAKHAAAGTPTFNDATKPGMKIEIPNGPWLEAFQQNIIAGSGRVARGPEFYLAVSGSAFSREGVLEFADMLLSSATRFGADEAKVMVRQTERTLDKYDIDPKSLGAAPLDVEWADLKAELWKIYNNFLEQRLSAKGRGDDGGKQKKDKSGKKEKSPKGKSSKKD